MVILHLNLEIIKKLNQHNILLTVSQTFYEYFEMSFNYCVEFEVFDFKFIIIVVRYYGYRLECVSCLASLQTY